MSQHLQCSFQVESGIEFYTRQWIMCQQLLHEKAYNSQADKNYLEFLQQYYQDELFSLEDFGSVLAALNTPIAESPRSP